MAWPSTDRRHDQTRVVLADDDPLVRELLRCYIDREPDLQVVGEAADSDDAVRCARNLAPDILLLDLVMPRRGGAAVAREVLATVPRTRIVVLTNRRSTKEARSLVALGVSGYLIKTAGCAQLATAIRAVRQGDAYFDVAVVAGLAASDPFRANGSPTAREAEALHLLAEGFDTRQIAASLGVGARTAEGLIASLASKLGAGPRAELVHRAHQSGWLT